jgi:hypothetical protein
MNQFDDRDNPDDSAEPRHDEGLAEETSAFGQRVKGKVKDIAGEVTGDESPNSQSIFTRRRNCWFSLHTNSIISSSTVTR